MKSVSAVSLVKVVNLVFCRRRPLLRLKIQPEPVKRLEFCLERFNRHRYRYEYSLFLEFNNQVNNLLVGIEQVLKFKQSNSLCGLSHRFTNYVSASKILRKMAQQTPEQKLNLIKDVDIDPQGRFKYVLIKVYVDDPTNTEESQELSKFVVRGYADCEFHADIYDRLTATLTRLGGLDSECVGGGRILHEKENKKISVFGYSQGFGRADHSKAVEILKTKYKDYEISWNNDGY